MAIVKQLDKRSGITYLYESTSRWDKAKRQSRATRRLIGRLDPATGAMVPTDGRMRKAKERAAAAPRDEAPPARLFAGATWLLDRIAEQTGLEEDLRRVFPESWRELLSVAQFMALSDGMPLYRFGKWGSLHRHPCGHDLPSQRSSELLASVAQERIDAFLRLRARRRAGDEAWACDSTSVSSYSTTLRQVRFGRNKENDPLAQVNLILLFGEKSGLPFYYRKTAGNVPDVKTVRGLVRDLDGLGFGHVRIVTDRGYYSEANLDELFGSHHKFLVGVSTSLGFVRKAIAELAPGMNAFGNYDPGAGANGATVRIAWAFRRKRPRKGDELRGERRLYVHVYHSLERATQDQARFMRELAQLREELETDRRVESHADKYAAYFTVRRTPKRGLRVEPNEAAVAERVSRFGYFALATNETMTAQEALHLYRAKDIVEKAFGNLKERLNLRRLLVSSEQGLDGKFFVAFVGLVLVSRLHRLMKDAKLYDELTMDELLDRLDVIEVFRRPGERERWGEILEKQKDIYRRLGVEPPPAL